MFLRRAWARQRDDNTRNVMTQFISQSVHYAAESNAAPPSAPQFPTAPSRAPRPPGGSPRTPAPVPPANTTGGCCTTSESRRKNCSRSPSLNGPTASRQFAGSSVPSARCSPPMCRAIVPQTCGGQMAAALPRWWGTRAAAPAPRSPPRSRMVTAPLLSISTRARASGT